MVYAGVPEDMLRKVLPYTKEYACTVDVRVRKELTDFFEPITPDGETAQFMFNWWSYILSGRRNEHQFHMIVGSGGNGKGLFDFLMKRALGDYMQSPDIALITSNKRGQLEAPSAIVATCMGALLITMQERGGSWRDY